MKKNTAYTISIALQVAEISRILRPGGIFVATTFIADGIFPLVPFLKALRQVDSVVPFTQDN